MMDEMTKLRKALDKKGIEWYDDSFASPFGWVGIVRTKFYNKDDVKCSVICGENTYGGEVGLLEVMPPLDRDPDYFDDVQGWLTADEIIAAWL